MEAAGYLETLVTIQWDYTISWIRRSVPKFSLPSDFLIREVFNGGCVRGLFNDAFINVASDGRMIDEWRRIGKDLEGNVCGLLKVLFRHLSRGTKGTTEILSQDSQYPIRDLNRVFLEEGIERHLQTNQFGSPLVWKIFVENRYSMTYIFITNQLSSCFHRT
jgi:hypothetical protein